MGDTEKTRDRAVAAGLFVLSAGFVIAMASSEAFFDWAFARHENQLSWFIRPLFIIPFCWFAYKRSLTGIAAVVLGILTSMFWFPAPDEASEQVKMFLQFEKDWLTGTWTFSKGFMALLAPLSLGLLALAFWKRNKLVGGAVMAMMAIGKVAWSVQNAGDAGASVIVPAVVGLIACMGFVFWALRRAEAKAAALP